MGSKAVDDLLETSSGIHFTKLHLNEVERRKHETDEPTTSTGNGHREPFVTGVAGGASAGKTTVCDMIVELLHDQRVVLINQESFYHNLSAAELGQVYDYNFDHPDADVRLARRIRRDTVEKGRDIGTVLDQYSKFVKPAFDDFILPTKKYADIIISRGGDNHVAVDLIVQHICTKLGQHDLCKVYPNLSVIPSTFQTRGMHTLIRDTQVAKHDFIFYSDRLIRLVVEHGLGHLPFKEKQVINPTGSVYTGVEFCKRLCGSL